MKGEAEFLLSFIQYFAAFMEDIDSIDKDIIFVENHNNHFHEIFISNEKSFFNITVIIQYIYLFIF